MFLSFHKRILTHLLLLLPLLILTLTYSMLFEIGVTYADAGGTSFSMQPLLDSANTATKGYFILDSKPATTLQNGIRVTNTGAVTGTVTLYAVDATTGQNSGLVYNAQNIPSHDVGSWLHLSQQQLTLAPGQSQDVPFSLNIPTGARPGQHIGGIVAKTVVQASTQRSNFHINVQSLTIVAVQLNVVGPQSDGLQMTGMQVGGTNGYQKLLVNLSNTGTSLLKPYGTLQILDAQGTILQNLNVKLDSFLPDTTINYPIYMQNHPLLSGAYTVNLQLTYGHQRALHVSQKLTVSQQQVTQVFKSQGPLHLPGGFSGWQLILLGLVVFFATGSMLFVGYSFSRRIVTVLAKKR